VSTPKTGSAVIVFRRTPVKLCLGSRWGHEYQIQNLKAGASNSNPKETPFADR
jgi:hypothetical protein